jgi:hypothetical protein
LRTRDRVVRRSLICDNIPRDPERVVMRCLAKLTNKSDVVLLPGEATVYVGGDFVGRMRLPLVAAGEPFIAGFGVDPQLQVSRRLVRKSRSI